MSSSSASSGVSSSSSSSSLRSLPPSVHAADPARIALDDCITRIKRVILKVKEGISNGNVNLNKITCPITTDVPEDPVVTNCGHIYERVAIQKWMDKGGSCSICKAPITTLSPIYALKDLIQDWQKEDPILTCSNFEGLNQKRADQYLALAKSCIDDKDYEEALKCYREALRFTNSAEVYANIPSLYETLEEKEKTTLSNLYLCLYLLQEGKNDWACRTLMWCDSDIVKFDPVVAAGLKLLTCQSPEFIARALELASAQTDREDKVFIYKQIIAYAPDQLDAYKELIPLITDATEKMALCLKAAEMAHNLEKSFRSEAEIPLVSTVITKSGWANAKTIDLPPYSQELKDFLDEDSTIWPGLKNSETLIVVPLFPMVDIDGTPEDSTLDSLDRLDRSSGGPGYRSYWDEIPKDTPAEKEFHWGVLTCEVLPGSSDKSHDDKIKLLKSKGYEMPGVFDAVRAILWENRRSGEQHFSYNSTTYTQCKKIHNTTNNTPLAIGGFDPNHHYLCVGISSCFDCKDHGVAGWRTF